MAAIWSDPVAGEFEDAYLDWSRLLRDRREALMPPPQPPLRFQPVFLRLKLSHHPSARAARDALAAYADAAGSPLRLDPHERAFLDARRVRPDPFKGLPDEYAVYVQEDAVLPRDLATILDRGIAVDLGNQDGDMPGPDDPTVHPWGQGQPIVAAIDDGFGFLNARFRRQTDDGTALQSRFGAIWIQALEHQRAGNGRVLAGDVLTGAEIDALCAETGVETAAYAALCNRIFAPAARRANEHAFTHGSHVLDLAAGAEPDDTSDPVRNWPLLAVQLPPEAIEDTSGTRFESYIVQAVRWILRTARQMDRTAPVVINLSLGIFAGPKDGSRFAEHQISREASLWEKVTGQPVRVVWSFGNNRRSRMGARVDLTGADPSVLLRVQPGDQTPSYVEIRPDAATPSSACELSITAPDGTASDFAVVAAGQMRKLSRADGADLARLYHVPAREFGDGVNSPAHYVLALAPTENRIAGEVLAPSGAWQIAMRHTGTDPAVMHLQVQRDDSLSGYSARARQAYFDAPDAWEWDSTGLSYEAFSDGSVLTPDASHNALTTALTRQVLSVGAVRLNPESNTQEPADYSARGAGWSVAGPVTASVADEGRMLSGVMGCGTMTGTSGFLSGTSAAAGQISRALALCAARIAANAASGGGSARDDFDDAVVSIADVDPGLQPFLGPFSVTPPSRRASRRDGTAPWAAPGA
ncbi:hypothetical protein KUH32_09560 [Thalassococcus sp. CAU 1522]|uniref:Peptidase S8/S53 domain-containing protein n=1 Tax=Thalassococcus arenae TaxID=2851652 RepID=A0ABS6N7L6_9RHOB|nr:S8 family serine peptidase [Thalassococcus arenae]MBV2360020.1 hypothetical protein [Thalassococcus arenae]